VRADDGYILLDKVTEPASPVTTLVGVGYVERLPANFTPAPNFTDFGTRENATIASDVLTITGGFVEVETQGAAATDDVVTIVCPSDTPDGAMLLLRNRFIGRTITYKDGTGNLRLPGDVVLDHPADTMLLTYDLSGDLWCYTPGNNS
jgi:hypothetical protein